MKLTTLFVRHNKIHSVCASLSKHRLGWCCFRMVKKLFFLVLIGFSALSGLAQDAVQDSSRVLTIRNIHILGNEKTKEQIITRELTVKPGDTRQLKELNDTLKFDRNRIYNTNLFNVVQVSLQELDSGQADILINVTERWYIYPVPLFKLADRNFNDWWVNRDRDFQRVNFGIVYSQFNVRGRAERLRLTAQTGFEDRFILNYKFPYIDKKQHHGLIPEVFLIQSKNLGFQTEDHLRTFIQAESEMRESLGVSLLHTYRKRFYDYHFSGVGIYNTNIADTIAFLNPNYLGDGRTHQRFMTATYGYQLDTRDNINYPKSGTNFIGSMTKTGLGFGDVDYVSANVRLAKYWNLNKGYTTAHSVQGYWSSDASRPLLNYYGLGFEPQVYVRGYELDLVEGSSFLLSKNSTRKLLWKSKAQLGKGMPIRQFRTIPIAFYGKIFFDGAYVWGFENNELNRRLTDKFIYGTGLGIDMVTIHDLVIRFEYSTNWDGETQFFLNFMTDI